MDESDITYYYAGQGYLYVAERREDGTTKAYRNLGTISSLILKMRDNSVYHRSSRSAGTPRDMMVSKGLDVDYEVAVENIVKENLALFTRGEFTPVGAGGITQYLEVELGGTLALSKIRVSGAVVTNQAGDVTYLVDVNYTLNAENGSITIKPDQSLAENQLANGQIIAVSYSYAEQFVIDPFVYQVKEYALRFEGLNIAESQSPVVVEIHRASQRIVNQLVLLSGAATQLIVTGAVLQDIKKPGNQYFRELVLA